ncbi:RidA family protein [Flavobacterium sp. CLA17]|uniref:RidA family protein n=1 Tax=Flavobacterium sp. CLA17 TaxID=2724135 RepID=UPI001490EA26|nr:RidA family protein [Flavobacterium sp. CLA17]QSB29225.1 RidA family protein [Flavobacterium sp. CLA17]
MKNILILLFSITSFTVAAQTADQKINQLGIQLPEISNSLGSYVDVVQVGNILYLSGKGPLRADGTYITGKAGQDLTTEQAYQASRLTAINQLAVLKKYLGSLDKIKRIVKVNGYVNTAGSFSEQSRVINGFSDLLVEVFGDSGKHARTSIGVASLPMQMAVEVELIVELK